MQIAEQVHGAVTVLRPAGPLTHEHAELFGGAVGNALSKSLGRFVIDATEMAFVDSAGLEALVDSADRLADSGLTLKLFGVNETVREVFELTETAEHFEHFADMHSAVRSFL